MDKITIDRALLEQALEALENSSPDQYPEGAGVFYDARDGIHAALDQPEEPHPDTVRLEYLYSRRGTDSMALVELEMKVLFGEPASLEEVRTAIDEAMANPSKEKNCG
jgi:hypothetical protein